MNVTSDTGIKMNMLQNFIFIPVDIFLDKLHNDGIQSELDAWLTFLGCDEPEYIIDLIQKYPYFKRLYEDLYNECLNVERVIEMFSEELRILDHNTVEYMIDDLQTRLDNALAEKEAAYAALADKDATIADMHAIINRLQAELDKYKK